MKTTPIPEQKRHWDQIHKDSDFRDKTQSETPFAQTVMQELQSGMRLLEIGTGSGNDASYFAKNGLEVVATDFSSEAITYNQEKYKDIPNLKFIELNTENIDTLEEGTFDVIYARLSLHYFNEEIMKKIISSIYDYLTEKGKFYFMCKSTKDISYGKGTAINKYMYVSDKGHVRYFFDEDYVKKLLEGKFEILKLEEKQGELYGQVDCGWIEVSAKKRI